MISVLKVKAKQRVILGSQAILCLILLTGCASTEAWFEKWFADQDTESAPTEADYPTARGGRIPAQATGSSSEPPAASNGATVSGAPANASAAASAGHAQELQQTPPLQYHPDYRDIYASQQAQPEQQKSLWLTPRTLYSPDFTHKRLTGYGEQLTMKLMEQNPAAEHIRRVGVASFVAFNQSLEQTSVLGNQMAEILMSELQEYGVTVVDFKMTGAIEIRQDGDFIFSRKHTKLPEQVSVDYMLGGTVMTNEKGATVNARIIAVDTREVVSSASLFIPHFIIEQLNPRFISL